MTDVLTVSEAARELGASAPTVRQWERDGKLPARRTGSGARIFEKSDVVRFRDERRRKQEYGE